MTEKEFLNLLTNGGEDVLQSFLDAVAQHKTRYCVIGGLAVNAYCEPVVSLDLDIVVAASDVESVCTTLGSTFRIERFEHSLNLSTPRSSLRLQIQTDPRYETFLERSRMAVVLGYQMLVAAVEDVLQGKIWACVDPDRRASKRQKDLADVARLIETHPRLESHVPESIRRQIQ